MVASTSNYRGSFSSSSSLHDDPTEDERLSDDADAIAEVMMRVKSLVEDMQDSSHSGFPSASRLGLDQDPLLAKIPGLESVISIPRDATFPLGLQAKVCLQRQLMKEYDPDGTLFGVEASPTPSILSKQEIALVKEIEKKSETLSHLMNSLLLLLYSKKMIKTTKGKQITEFAKALIAQVPDVLAQSPEALSTEEQLQFLAQTIKNIQQLGDDEDNDIERKEEEAIEHLGCLLLLTQRNPNEAVRCATLGDFQASIDEMHDSATRLIKSSFQTITQHAAAHKKAAIQDFEEASFHKMSMEMAELLLLDNGDINTGIINLVSSLLIPKQWHSYLAVETLMMVLSDLASSPAVRQEIASISTPNSPKNPSCLAIRVCLGLKHDAEITSRHAQKFVLSALLGHYRQAKVGSCFATAWLIKALHHHLSLFVDDLKQLTEEGCIERIMFGECRMFPYHARVSKEYLDTIIEVDAKGQIIHTMGYELKPYQQHLWAQPNGVYIHEAPGFIAVCRTLGIVNVKEAIQQCVSLLPTRFAAEEMVKKLASYAYQYQESRPRQLRSEERLTEAEMVKRAEFAFGVQTNHPLHLAYDQVGASLVNYFASQYTMPAWIYHTMTDILKGAVKGRTIEFQRMYHTLLKEMFLPMIIRLRFLYNPHSDRSLRLFDDGNYGRSGNDFYGYEAYDCGLPGDFVYSTNLWNSYKNQTSTIRLERFQEYEPGYTWKPINTEETFTHFIQEVLNGTIAHLTANETATNPLKWNQVAEKMTKDITTSSFFRKVIFNMLGKESDQKKEWLKNPYTLSTTPWRFAWGGDFNEVMKGYFGFQLSPSKMKPFIDGAKGVLAKCINFIKEQPAEIRSDMDDERSMFMITSPVHAFLLTPNEESFQEAWKSEMDTNAYIAEYVEKPGMQVANKRLNPRQRQEIVTFILKNQWVSPAMEKDDYNRQQLTTQSKQEFDRLISEMGSPSSLSVIDFQKQLVNIVANARAADKRIGRRNSAWEHIFELSLRNFTNARVPEANRDFRVSPEMVRQMINFARNRKDTVALSEEGKAKFSEYVREIPEGISMKDYRKAVVEAAYKAYRSDICREDMGWKSSLGTEIDNLLYRKLPKAVQNRLIESSIVTHDSNWKMGIHDMRLMFMVNPGTGKIELCNFVPDTNKVTFFGQSSWFPRKSKDHGYWEFPDNYRVWASEPLFNAKLHMDV